LIDEPASVREIDQFLSSIAEWAQGQPDIQAVALVGSWARGTARPDSDIDLVIVVADPGVYLGDEAWLHRFGTPSSIADEDWGLVQSRRVIYASGLEVEFGLTINAWLATDPIDAGSAQVVADGVRILLDRTGALARFVAQVAQEGIQPVKGALGSPSRRAL
jgi:predicted nucleotidyltransferase